jgi:hypothetical protein
MLPADAVSSWVFIMIFSPSITSPDLNHCARYAPTETHKNASTKLTRPCHRTLAGSAGRDVQQPVQPARRRDRQVKPVALIQPAFAGGHSNGTAG